MFFFVFLASFHCAVFLNLLKQKLPQVCPKRVGEVGGGGARPLFDNIQK